MPTTSCPSCGLPRAEELLAVAPCPLCGADGLPVADEIPATPPAVELTPAATPPPPPRGGSRFGLGLAVGLMLGAAFGAGGVLGWQARPTSSPEPGSNEVAAAPPADAPVPLPPSPKSADVPPPKSPPTAKSKDTPTPLPQTAPPVVLDNPDGETRPVVRPGGRLTLSGKVRRLVVPGLKAAAVLDAAQLEVAEVEVVGPVEGGARLVVRAPGGVVRFRAPLTGGAVADVTGREVVFEQPLDGAGTRATVTLTREGVLTFAAVGAGARLEYRRADPGGPAPKLTAGRVTPPGAVVEVQ